MISDILSKISGMTGITVVEQAKKTAGFARVSVLLVMVAVVVAILLVYLL